MVWGQFWTLWATFGRRRGWSTNRFLRSCIAPEPKMAPRPRPRASRTPTNPNFLLFFKDCSLNSVMIFQHALVDSIPVLVQWITSYTFWHPLLRHRADANAWDNYSHKIASAISPSWNMSRHGGGKAEGNWIYVFASLLRHPNFHICGPMEDTT